MTSVFHILLSYLLLLSHLLLLLSLIDLQISLVPIIATKLSSVPNSTVYVLPTTTPNVHPIQTRSKTQSGQNLSLQALLTSVDSLDALVYENPKSIYVDEDYSAFQINNTWYVVELPVVGYPLDSNGFSK